MLQHIQAANGIDNQQLLAERIGVNRSALSAAKNGDPRYCNARLAHRINAAFGNPFSASWIETGEGSMFATPQQTIIGDNNHHSQNAAPAELLERLAQSQNQIDELLRQQSAYLRIITNLSERKQ